MASAQEPLAQCNSKLDMLASSKTMPSYQEQAHWQPYTLPTPVLSKPCTIKLGGLPNISYILRKPEPLGIEFKTSVCPVLNVMVYM
jgi:hypothetical protein